MADRYSELTAISMTNYRSVYFDGKVQGWQKVTFDFLRKKFLLQIYLHDFFDGERPLLYDEVSLTRSEANRFYRDFDDSGLREGDFPYAKEDPDWQLEEVLGDVSIIREGQGPGPKGSQELAAKLAASFEGPIPLALFQTKIPPQEVQDRLKNLSREMLRLQQVYLTAEAQFQRLAENEKKNKHKSAIFYDAADIVVQKIYKRMDLAGEVDQTVLDFIGNFLHGYQMQVGGFQENVAENAYNYGFFQLPKLLLGYEAASDKDFLKLIEDGLNLGSKSPQPLIRHDQVTIFMDNLSQGLADWGLALTKPAFEDLKQYYLAKPEKKEPEAQLSEFAETALRESEAAAIDEIFEFLVMFDSHHTENTDDFAGELIQSAMLEIGYEPALWDSDDFEFLGKLYLDSWLTTHQLDLETAIITAGTALLSLNFVNDYPEKEQVLPLVKALLTGYNTDLEAEGKKTVTVPDDEALQTLLEKYQLKDVVRMMSNQKKRHAAAAAHAAWAEKSAAVKAAHKKKLIPAKSGEVLALEAYHKKMKKKRK